MLDTARRSAVVAVVLLLMASCVSCDSGYYPTNYFVLSMKIDSDQHLIPVGHKLLFHPAADSYYMFFNTATQLTLVNHFAKQVQGGDARELLYLEAYKGRLERTVKDDEIVTGPFGAVITQKTCYYHTPTSGYLSSIKVLIQSAKPDIGREVPIAVSKAPSNLPPLTSISIVRIFHVDNLLAFASGNYETNGTIGSVQSGKVVNGQVQYGASIMFPIAPPFNKDLNTVRQTYGLPNRIRVKDYLQFKRMLMPKVSKPEEHTFVVLVYGFGKFIRQDSLKDGTVRSSRYMMPVITKEDRILGPECDEHLSQQQASGQPTVK